MRADTSDWGQVISSCSPEPTPLYIQVMPEGASPILQLPKLKKITKRSIPHVDRDHKSGWKVAGPLFEAGVTSLNIAEWPVYKGTRHIPTQHRLGLVVQGEIRFQCGKKTITAKRGDLVFTPAATVLQRTGVGPVAWCYMDLENSSTWAPLMEIGFYVRKYESADLMYILARRIIDALRSQDVYSIHCAKESAMTMVGLLKTEFNQPHKAWSSKRMNSIVTIIDRIRARPDLEWDRRTIAHALNTSERNLTREFKRIYNMPPSKMVANIRMDLASRLLINTDRTLIDIASSVGYESAFSFSRLFKKYAGVAPEHYRTMTEGERCNTHSAPNA